MPRPCRHGCSQLLPLPPLLQCPGPFNGLGGGGMVNEERAALLKQMPVPPRGKRNTPLCLQEMLAHGPGVLAFPVTYRVTRHLLKPLTGGQSQGLWFRLQCSCPLVHPIRDQWVISSVSCKICCLLFKTKSSSSFHRYRTVWRFWVAQIYTDI